MTTWYTAVVKGNRFDAARAAADRGIPAAFLHEVPDLILDSGIPVKFNESVLKISAQFLDKLASWFGEAPFDPPYPVGTLLIYSEHKEEEEWMNTRSSSSSSLRKVASM